MQTALGPEADGGTFRIVDGFVDHPYLKPGSVQARTFQVDLALRALHAPLLVVVPTGLGKTLVAALVAAETLRQRRGTVLLLAPTRPLALQHVETMRRLLRDEGLIHLLSGGVPPARRAQLWRSGVLLVATPQTVRNDLNEERYDLAPLALVVFDEAHRAVGDYAYVELGTRLRMENPRARVLGLTASPGAKRERLREVCQNLGVPEANVALRDTTSPDVAGYVQRIQIEPRFVELTPTLRRVAKPFHALMTEKEQRLRDWGLVKGSRPHGLTKRELVALQQSLGRSGGRGPFVFAALHAAALAHYARLCIDYAEIYGLDALKRYLDRMRARTDLKRNEKSFLNHAQTQEAFALLEKGIEQSHPKMDELWGVLKEARARRSDAIAIVFCQYRDAVAGLVESLRRQGYSAERFVGQSSRGDEGGLDQEAQRDVLARFARREFQVLVSTSVGEEGIDVPQVDLVVFYDAVPSEIRSIQRRGRTGRTVPGRVVVLVTRDSSDEGAYWAALRRETRMRRLVARPSTPAAPRRSPR